MKRFGLIGRSLVHSFSRKYFTEKFSREHLADCTYELFELPSIDGLPALLQSLPDIKGLNVTVPFKESVLPFLHFMDPVVQTIGACNCIRIDEGNLNGFNTDAPGFERSLLPLLKSYHEHALILGSGGAAKAIGFVLDKLGISYQIVSRSKKGQIHYADLGKEVMEKSTLIIQATPLGTFPETDQFPEIPYEWITEKHLLFDLVYNPEITAFMQKGLEKGAVVSNGHQMLAAQAELSWQIWNYKA